MLINAEYPRANQWLVNYQQLYGKDDSYLREQARYYALTGNKNAALDIVDKLLTVYKNDKDLEGIKQYAITHEKKVAPKIQPPINPLIAQAQKAIETKNYKEAIRFYELYLSKNPSDKQQMIRLINLLLIEGQFKKAEALLTDYRNRFNEDKEYLIEKARYFALTNKSKESLAILEPLLKKEPQNKALLEIKNYALTHKEVQPKIVAKEKAFIPEKPLPPPNIVIPAQPKVNPLLVAAENAIRSKNLKQAISLYENYLKQYPNDKIIKIKFINLLLINAQYPLANQLLVNYQQLYGKDNSYLREQARYYALTGNKNAALDIVDKLLKVYKSDKDLEGIKQYAITHEKKMAPKIQPPINPLIAQAQKAIEAKSYKEAIRLYQSYLSKNPSDKQQTIKLINLLLIDSQYKKAEELLAAYRKRFNEDKEYLTEKARFYALTNKSKEALAILEPLLKKEPQNKALLEIKKYALTHKETQAKKVSKEEACKLFCLAFQSCDAEIYAKAAKANYDAESYKEALTLIDQAACFAPTNESYLLTRVEIGKKLESKEIVFWSYNRLYKLNPCKKEYILEYARAATNRGCLDFPSNLYVEYICKWPFESKPWLEYAYIENWKGNYRKAICILDKYYELFGSSDDYLITRANIVASANHPYEALAITEPMIGRLKDNYDLNYGRTIALYYGNFPVQMLRSLMRVSLLKPGTEQTKGLIEFITAPYRSRVTGDAYHSEDTDSVNITWGMVTGQLYTSPLSSFLADFKDETLKADITSGLAPITGGESIQIRRERAGASYRFNQHFLLIGEAGVTSATKSGGDFFIYQIDAQTRINNRMRVDFLFKDDFYDVSARAVSLSIRQRLNQASLFWEPAPTIQTYINSRVAYAKYSDDNEMKLMEVTPRTYMLATEKVNVIMGLNGLWYGFTRQRGHGYYDPSRYEFYSANINITYKPSDNFNYVFNFSRGMQKDETFRNYRPANDYSGQAYLGIYKDWYLILTANLSTRGRSIGTARINNKYEVYSLTATLTKRIGRPSCQPCGPCMYDY